MSLRRGVAGTTPHRSASVWMPFARSLTSNLVREQGGAANATEHRIEMAGRHAGEPLQSLVEPLVRLPIRYGEYLHDGPSELRIPGSAETFGQAPIRSHPPCRGERPPVRKAGRQITVKAPGQIQAGSGPPRTGETPHQTVGHPPL